MSKRGYELAKQRIAQFRDERPTLSENDSIERIAEMLHAEALELLEAVRAAHVTNNTEDVLLEIADILAFVFTLCATIGIDPVQLLHIKIDRNESKFPTAGYQNGTPYKKQMKSDKQSWIGDIIWSHKHFDTIE